MIITKLQNPKIQHLVKLSKDSKYRRETQKILLVGETMIREFDGEILCIIDMKKNSFKAKEHLLVTPEILQKVSNLETFSGPIAEVDYPKEQELKNPKFLMILDLLQDPGNVGTLLRSALGLGWDGVIATKGTVDFCNDKVLRASQGAALKIPFCYKTEEDLIRYLESQKMHVMIADARGIPLDQIQVQTPIAIVLSNEGSGLSTWAKNFGNPIAMIEEDENLQFYNQ